MKEVKENKFKPKGYFKIRDGNLILVKW
jgi:hypothetical protein